MFKSYKCNIVHSLWYLSKTRQYVKVKCQLNSITNVSTTGQHIYINKTTVHSMFPPILIAQISFGQSWTVIIIDFLYLYVHKLRLVYLNLVYREILYILYMCSITHGTVKRDFIKLAAVNFYMRRQTAAWYLFCWFVSWLIYWLTCVS